MPEEKKNNIRGITGTLVFHLTLLAVILYFGFITPLPLPDEQGILINFGTDDVGSGEQQPQEQPVQATQVPVPEPVTETAEPEHMTQDFQEAPVVERQRPEQPREPIEPQPVQEPVTAPTPPREEVAEKREVDQRSLFPGRSPDSPSTSEGPGYEPGNMGDPSGDARGSHTGTGAGESGISFSLDGRIAQSLPVPEYNYQRGGIVVVEITVNKEGRVTEAIAGVRGSTTLDEYLLRVARNAALAARFDRSPDAPAFQKGTITYHFKLQ